MTAWTRFGFWPEERKPTFFWIRLIHFEFLISQTRRGNCNYQKKERHGAHDIIGCIGFETARAFDPPPPARSSSAPAICGSFVSGMPVATNHCPTESRWHPLLSTQLAAASSFLSGSSCEQISSLANNVSQNPVMPLPSSPPAPPRWASSGCHLQPRCCAGSESGVKSGTFMCGVCMCVSV